MSEATIAEPPVVEKPTPPAPSPGAVTIDLGNLGKKAVASKEEKKLETTATSSTTEVEKAATPETTPVDPAKKPNDKEHNMAELRKAREAAEAARKEVEAERDRIKAELESLRTKAPELPEDVKSKLTTVEQLEKERAELTQRLRQADLARDPEFQAKYNTQITGRIQVMGEAALAAGVPQEDWKRAVSNWNEEQFAEWSETMTPIQRVKFNAAWTAAVDLYQQQQQELSNASKSYEELIKQRQADAEAQQKQHFTQNEQLARSVMNEVIKPEVLKEYEDLGPAAEALVMKAARYEIPAKDIFQNLVHNQVLARVTVKQKTRIEELEGQLAERDKKIQEQDEFIAQHAGAVPRGDAAGKTTASDDKTPIWANLVVKA